AEDRVGDRRDRRSPKRQPIGSQRAIGSRQSPKITPRKPARANDQPGEGNQNERAKVQQRETHRQPETGQSAESLFSHVQELRERLARLPSGWKPQIRGQGRARLSPGRHSRNQKGVTLSMGTPQSVAL